MLDDEDGQVLGEPSIRAINHSISAADIPAVGSSNMTKVGSVASPTVSALLDQRDLRAERVVRIKSLLKQLGVAMVGTLLAHDHLHPLTVNGIRRHTRKAK